VATLSGTSGQDDGPQTPHARYFRLPRKRRRWPWVLGYTIWALLGLVVAVAWGVDRAAQHLLDQISPNIPTVTDARKALDKPTGPDTTFIILGSDNRSWVPGSENLSDSIILVHLDPPQNLISIMSVPRDLAVTIPGYAGTQKINAAFSLGADQPLCGCRLRGVLHDRAAPGRPVHPGRPALLQRGRRRLFPD
jgi:anionic cell wall polymer biosynthesis LytR-Cps2A-Psr (LCP) family protein